MTPPRHAPRVDRQVESDPDGTLTKYAGAGLTIPWGIAVDSDDTIWVANFTGQRVSHLCGARVATCPTGVAGDPISPSGGYAFDGLQRNTGVQIDPSGNVWAHQQLEEDPLPGQPVRPWPGRLPRHGGAGPYPLIGPQLPRRRCPAARRRSGVATSQVARSRFRPTSSGEVMQPGRRGASSSDVAGRSCSLWLPEPDADVRWVMRGGCRGRFVGRLRGGLQDLAGEVV